MHYRLKYLSLALLCLSLMVSLELVSKGWMIQNVFAQTSTNINSKTEADKFFQQGLQQSRQGYDLQASQTYQKALVIYRQLGDKAGEAQTLNNLGEVYNELDRDRQALEVLQPALSLRQQLGDRAGVGETLDNIGSTYIVKKEYDKALDYLQQALTIRKEPKLN